MLATALACALALVAAYLAAAVLYQLFYAAAGAMPAPEPVARDGKLRRFVIFVPAGPGDHATVETARRALKQRYPRGSFEVVVLADRLPPATLSALGRLDVTTLAMGFCESTKGKSLREGILATRARGFDAALLLAPGHHVAPDFLLEANRYLAAGFRAVQAQRTVAPTQPDDAAAWDAVTEAIDNHVLGAGHHALGRSALLRDTGLVLDFGLFDEVLQDVHTTGDFTDALASQLAARRESVAYASRARVYRRRRRHNGPPDRTRDRGLPDRYRRARRHLRRAARDFPSGLAGPSHGLARAVLPPPLLLPPLLLTLMTATLPLSLAWSATFAALLMLSVAGLALALPPRRWARTSRMLVARLPQLLWQTSGPTGPVAALAKTEHPAPGIAEVAEVLAIDTEYAEVPRDRPPR